MQKTLHKAKDRGYFNHGWLKTHHSFSFADYYNPAMMGFGVLRVINDDEIAPGMGFGLHPHENMEIVTVVLSGALRHEDSMGNTSVIHAGEVQVMSAGTGVWHSEYNASATDPLILFQIWILPGKNNVTPRYAEQVVGQPTPNVFREVVGPEGSGAPLWIHQNASIALATIESGQTAEYMVKRPGNGVYVLVVEGEVGVEGEALGQRDALAITEAEKVEIFSMAGARVMILEVPIR